jgi:heme/copper-type cytochrome/quinol oxidase subunit 1
MTVTADAPAAAPASESTAPAPVPTGLAAILGSGDHKVVGRIWLAVAMLHLLLLGTATVLVSAERIDSSVFDVLGRRWIVPVDTFQFISLVFLFLVPLTIAVATAVVPLQVGAATLAFPRASASAAWGYLLGGGLLVAAYAMHGGPDGTDEKGAVLFTVAFGMLLLSLLVAWICIATTVITLRTTGMRLIRVPLFAWSALVAGGVWILTLPVLIGLSILSYLDAQYGGFLGGGAGSAYGRIAWAFGTPAVYVLAVPVLGFVGSVVPVFFQTRHQQHRVALGLIGAFGVLSVGAWTIPGLSGATPWLYKGPWVVVSFAVLLPLLGLVGLWALTARQGRLSFGSPVLFALSATLLLLLGAAAGAVQAVKPIKTVVDGPGTSLYGTSWSTAVLGIVALAGITAMVGGVVYWAPKLVGHRFPEGGARLVAVLLLLGTLVTGVPELVAGLLGQPASAALAPAQHVATIEHLELVATIGNGLLVLAGLLFILLLLRAATSGVPAGDDPWSGHTLEWATTSPPPIGNFAELPKISSEAPLYDARHRPEEADAR